MAKLDLAAFAAPLADDDPCGIDLDFEGDADFMNFVARIEGVLPAQYYARDKDGRQITFERVDGFTPIEYVKELAVIGKFFDRTRDLRLLVIGAKLLALSKDLGEFGATIKTIADALSQYWMEIHPRGDDDQFMLRNVALQGLDDRATVALPLQAMPLVRSRRLGQISYRTFLIATGAIQIAEDDLPPDTPRIDKAGLEAVLMEKADNDIEEMVTAREHVSGLQAAFGQIRATWLERAGFDNAVSFDTVTPILDGIFSFLNDAVGRRDPSRRTGSASVAETAGEAGTIQAGTHGPAPIQVPLVGIANRDAAADALTRALQYFARHEPSSPAVLLIHQARQLMGKSLLEVIQVLFPSDVDKATIRIGEAQGFSLPIERMASVAEENGASNGYGGESQTAADESWGSSDWGESASGDTAADDQDGTDTDGGEISENGVADGEPVAQPRSVEAGGESKHETSVSVSEVTTRGDAVGMLQGVATFYRHAEPSNPIPLLLDKACALAQRDFLSLISDILPGVGTPPSEESY